MADGLGGGVKYHFNLEKLKEFKRKSPEHFHQAAKIGAAAWLNWANMGSKNESRKPPIKWGVLRGSSSAFVGKELVMIFPAELLSGAQGKATPAKAFSGKELMITWVWNTEYGAKMHEWNGGWGDATERDTDAGNKWAEKHLLKDKNDLIEVIGKEFRKVSKL